MNSLFKNRSRSGGHPEASTGTLSTLRRAAVAYHRVPGGYAALAALLLTALTSAAAYSIGAPVHVTAAATVGILASAHLVLRHPGVVATMAVLAAAVMTIPPVATAYAYWASDGAITRVDLSAAFVTLGATYLLVALLAHRTSRGRAWVTTALAVIAVVIAGPFLAAIYAPLGFGWAWLCAGTVLWLRGGGIAWLADQRYRFTTSYRAAATEQQMEQDRAAACAATAAILDTLPDGYTVFHGRRTPRYNKRETHRVDHLVVGPTGLTVVTTRAFKGRVINDPDHGLVHDVAGHAVDVSGLLNDADMLATIIATRTKMSWLPVRQVVVLHDAVLPAKRSRVGLVAADGHTLGVLTVMGPAMLAEHISDPDQRVEQRLTSAEVARATARIDRLCPPDRTHPLTTNGLRARRNAGSIAAYRADMVVMDNDGNRRIPTPTAPQPMFATSDSPFDVSDGQQVCLLTDQGVFDGYHVAGDPVLGDDGITRVPVLDETINLAAHQATGADTLPLLWMPFDSIQPLARS